MMRFGRVGRWAGGAALAAACCAGLAAAPGARAQDDTDTALLTLQRQTPGAFAAGQPLEVVVTIASNGDGNVTAMGLYETAPPNWSFEGLRAVSGDPPAVPPQPGPSPDGRFEFAWISQPAFPVSFAYTVRPPEDAAGSAFISGQVEYRQGGPALKSPVEISELGGPDTPPTLQLNGGDYVSWPQGEPWADPGYSANDSTDGDLTGSVTVSGSVNSNQPGSYTLTYSVRDSGGNTATAQRTVEVEAGPPGGGGGGVVRPRPRTGPIAGGGVGTRPRPNANPTSNAGTDPNTGTAAEAAGGRGTKTAEAGAAKGAAGLAVPPGMRVPEAPVVPPGDRAPLDRERLGEIVAKLSPPKPETEAAGGDAAGGAPGGDAPGAGAAAEAGGDPGAEAARAKLASAVGAVPAPAVAMPAAQAALAGSEAQPGFFARVAARLGAVTAGDALTLLLAIAVIAGIGGLAAYAWRAAYAGPAPRKPGA